MNLVPSEVRREEFPLTPAMLAAMRRARSRAIVLFGGFIIFFSLILIFFLLVGSRLGGGLSPIFVVVAVALGAGIIAIVYRVRKSAIPIEPGGTFLRVTGPAKIVEVERSLEDSTYTVTYLAIDGRQYVLPQREITIVSQAVAHWPLLTAEVARDRAILFELWDAWGNNLYRLAGYVPDARRDGPPPSGREP